MAHLYHPLVYRPLSTIGNTVHLTAAFLRSIMIEYTWTYVYTRELDLWKFLSYVISQQGSIAVW